MRDPAWAWHKLTGRPYVPVPDDRPVVDWGRRVPPDQRRELILGVRREAWMVAMAVVAATYESRQGMG